MCTVCTHTRILYSHLAPLQNETPKKGLPTHFLEKTTAIIKFKNRKKFLQAKKSQQYTVSPPLFKYLPPSQYTLLKQISYTRLHNKTTLHLPTLRGPATPNPAKQTSSLTSHPNRWAIPRCHFIDRLFKPSRTYYHSKTSSTPSSICWYITL